MQKRTRIALGAGILVIGMTALTGCASLTEPWNDAPVSTKDDSPAEIYSMPDGFANVATKCDKHGNRIYSTRADANGAGKAVAVVPQDPSCKK